MTGEVIAANRTQVGTQSPPARQRGWFLDWIQHRLACQALPSFGSPAFSHALLPVELAPVLAMIRPPLRLSKTALTTIGRRGVSDGNGMIVWRFR